MMTFLVGKLVLWILQKYWEGVIWTSTKYWQEF